MIAIKNPIRDITAYLEDREVDSLHESLLETTIYEEGRKRMSHKKFKIRLNGHDKVDVHARKRKDENTTSYTVSLSSQYYAQFRDEGEMQVFIQDPYNASTNQMIRIKNVGKLSHSEQEKYYRYKRTIEQITNSQ